MALKQAMTMTSIMTNSLSKVDPMSGAHCCLICRKEIRRLEKVIMGRVFRPLPVCDCVKQRFLEEQKEMELKMKRDRIRRLYGDGLIDKELQGASFDNFNPRSGTENALRLAQHFVNKFKEQTFGLYLFGPKGAGKSHLAAAIHHELLRQGFASVFIDTSQLFGLAKATFNKQTNRTDQDYIRAAIGAELLVLDEIGLAPLSNYEFQLLFQIVNGRKGKPTIYTSNLDLSRLREWLKRDRNGQPLDEDERIFDRIVGGALPIEIKAESYRQFLAKERARQILAELAQ